MPKKIDLSKPKNIRQKTGESQTTFWGRFGVLQSAASRYESGRKMPEPLKSLMKAWLAGFLTNKHLEALLKK